jgi:hypothetical protein
MANFMGLVCGGAGLAKSQTLSDFCIGYGADAISGLRHE